VATSKRAPRAKNVTSVITFDGAALRGGEMDVRDLAPALLAIGDLVSDANRRLNGNRADVSVRVQAKFRRGSFGVTISLAQTVIQHAQNLFDGASLYDAVALAKLLGLTILAEKPKEVVENVFELLKFLGGEKDATREVIPGEGMIRITNRRGGTKIVNNGVLILYDDNSVRNDIRRVVAPLNSPGIDRFETSDDGVTVERITREDMPAIVATPEVNEAVMVAGDSPAIETRSVGLFQIVSLNFREGNKWQLNAGHGDFWAEIADPVFLNKVHRHIIVFGEGDVLKAEYVATSIRQGNKIKSDVRIVNVLDVIPPIDPASTQNSLIES
jgi:hypothetical protein